MAEAVGIFGNTSVGECAAQLSLALFSVVQTLKNAPKEIADIAEELSSLAESLQALADIIDAHRNLCKPALFKNTHSIILRYKQVDAEIKKLIDTPKKLVGLKSLIQRPKAKGLLKKVEGIKTALVLELNILRLAREEFARPYPNIGSTTQIESTPRSNRYRKIVESAVQANRQVVESAQRDDNDSGVERRHYTAAEIDVWKEGSFDTATWLYHLVFSPQITPPPNTQTRRLYQASVTDESRETIGSSSRLSSTTTIPDRQSSTQQENAMIVWSRQTEPSKVVDRLLLSWTTLSSDQITLSSTRHEGDDWREEVVRMIEEAKEEDGLTFEQWEQQNELADSEDEEFRSAEEESVSDLVSPPYAYRSNATSDRNRRLRPNSTDEWTQSQAYGGAQTREARQEGRSGRDTGRQALRSGPHVNWQEPSRSPPRPPRRRARTEESPPASAGPVRAESRVHTTYSERSDRPAHSRRRQSPPHGRDVPPMPTPGASNPFANTQFAPAPGFPNPFTPNPNPFSSNPNPIPPSVPPGHMPPWRDPYLGPHFPVYPQDPSRPSYLPPESQWQDTHQVAPQTASPSKPGPTVEKESAELDTMAKEKAVVAAIERLLERRGQEPKPDSNDPRFSRLMQLLTVQQEHDAQIEREHIKATAEHQMKQMQAAREKDEERLKQLESFIGEQKEAQWKMEAMWKEDRKAMDERAKVQAMEARDLASKEIAAAQSAKEAAQNALNFAKAEADKRAQEKAEARVAEKQKRVEDQHKQQLQRYEELLQVLRGQRSKPELGDQPIRRTRIADGNRSVDVTEYSATRREPPIFASSSPWNFFQEEISRFDTRLERVNDRFHPQRIRRDNFRSSATSMHSSRASLGNRNTPSITEKSQQLIVFPAKANRSSPKISELQNSLATFGVDSVFEDPDDMHNSQLVPYDYEDASEQIVRSTIFWEASVLSLGSELLCTLRQAGWRPTYSRISDKGQTHFLGSQPIHTYFFSPDYRPQFLPSTTAALSHDSIVIQKALVEEYALIELGFLFKSTDTGLYILDGRLTHSDIEALIERSFLIKENNHRRLHRQLQLHYDNKPATPATSANPYAETYAPSLTSSASVYAGDDPTTCGEADTEGEDNSTAAGASQHDFGDVNRFRVPPYEGSERSGATGDDVPALNRDEISVESPSVASWASASTNPFRKHMNKVKEDTNLGVEPHFMEKSIWDDPTVHQ